MLAGRSGATLPLINVSLMKLDSFECSKQISICAADIAI